MQTGLELTIRLCVIDPVQGNETEVFPGIRNTYNAVLILSVGVTARTLSTTPAAMPANSPPPAESFPCSSDKEFRIVS